MRSRRPLERFTVAVRLLATGRPGIHGRLISAWKQLSQLDVNELPDEVHQEFEALADLWADAPAEGAGQIENAALALSEDAAVEASETILYMQYQLRNSQERDSRVLARSS